MMAGLDKGGWIWIGICTNTTLLGSGKDAGLGSNKSSFCPDFLKHCKFFDIIVNILGSKAWILLYLGG